MCNGLFSQAYTTPSEKCVLSQCHIILVELCHSQAQMLTALHRLESLLPRLKSSSLPLDDRLPQERLLQLLLEARDAVVDRRQVIQEREVPHQAVLCLTYQSSKDAPAGRPPKPLNINGIVPALVH